MLKAGIDGTISKGRGQDSFRDIKSRGRSLVCQFNSRERAALPAPVKGEIVGVDVGLDAFAIFSTGEKKIAPKPLERKIKPLSIYQNNIV